MKSDDLATLIASQGSPGIDLHIGLVKAWSADSGTNTIEVLGTDVYDIPVLTSAGIVSLQSGTSVVIMRYKNTYFVIGQVVGVGSELAQPQFPVVMYPMFETSLGAGVTGSANVPAGVLADWEGRLKPAHPRISVDGIWGRASGTGTTTYALRINGVTVGSWTSDAFEVSKKGPFDISQFVGLSSSWLSVQLSIIASPGAGQKYIQVLGVYLEQE